MTSSVLPFMPPEGQADKRRVYRQADQWGREWVINVEIKTDHPCGPVRPYKWDDPLHTAQFLHVPHGGRGQITINFEAWIGAAKQSLQQWQDLVDSIGEAKMGIAYDPAHPREDVVRAAGPRPQPDFRILELADQGDPRLLGFEPMPVKLEHYLHWAGTHGIAEVTDDHAELLEQPRAPSEPDSAEIDAEYAAFLANGPDWKAFFGFWRKRDSALSMREIAQRWKTDRRVSGGDR